MSHRFHMPDHVTCKFLGSLLVAGALAARAVGNPIALTHDDTESLLSTPRRGFPGSLALGARDDAMNSAPRVAPFEGADGRLVAPFSARSDPNGVARLEVIDDLGMDQPLVPAAPPGKPGAKHATTPPRVSSPRRARSTVTDAILGGASSRGDSSALDYRTTPRRLPRRSGRGTAAIGTPLEQRWILGPVPEPASWVTWVLGGTGIFLAHRRFAARCRQCANHGPPSTGGA